MLRTMSSRGRGEIQGLGFRVWDLGLGGDVADDEQQRPG
jgi:hypothetical protein